jgi:hypothetical protein
MTDGLTTESPVAKPVLVKAGEFNDLSASALDANPRHSFAFAFQGDGGLGAKVL